MRKTNDIACPDDPIGGIRLTALREIRAIAAQATEAAAGNLQLVDLAIAIGAAKTVGRARAIAATALVSSKTNRALQDFALDVLNRLRGL